MAMRPLRYLLDLRCQKGGCIGALVAVTQAVKNGKFAGVICVDIVRRDPVNILRMIEAQEAYLHFPLPTRKTATPEKIVFLQFST